jgi:hypothetical protein
MPKDGKFTASVGTALLLSCCSIGGCATSTVGSSAMDAHAEVPSKTIGHSALEEVPPQRETPGMTADERLKLRNELIVARDRQASKAKGQTTSPQP